MQKIINEVLAANPQGLGLGEGQSPNMTFAKEARDLLIECCVEFITMLSTEANEIAEKDAKKTIACEHITKALQDLGFGEYVPELMLVADSFKTSQAVCALTEIKLVSYADCSSVDTREEAVQDRAEWSVQRGTHPCSGGALQIRRRKIRRF